MDLVAGAASGLVNALLHTKGKLIKIGRSLAVGEVSLYSEGHDEMRAHAVGTYAIPRSRAG